uniref:2Fe-2S ferredoxin (Trinotate prediction) n=1 Tax=Henneguya salminicola TaxID=69463 RepID=A0A6G3MJ00_HENSL
MMQPILSNIHIIKNKLFMLSNPFSRICLFFRKKCSFCTETISVKFIQNDGSEKKIRGCIGSTVLEVAKKNSIDLEGACEGSCACSTCHVYVDVNYQKYMQPPSIQY